jgi:hypothetical protein
MAEVTDPILIGSPFRLSAVDIGTTEVPLSTIEDPIIVIGLIVANKTVNNVRTIVYYTPSDGQKTVRWGPRTIPPGEALEIAAGSRDVLMPGDVISLRASQDYSLDCWVSYTK